jgi:hypothetical protein
MAKRKGMYIDPKNRGKYTARAKSHGKSLGQQISSDLKPGSGASGLAKKRANFARMARRGFKPLGRKSGRKSR